MKLLHGKITVGLFDTRILKLLSDFTMGKKRVEEPVSITEPESNESDWKPRGYIKVVWT